MTLDDLVCIGKLGNSSQAPEGFLQFKPGWNFREFFLEHKDVFLIFPDYRVRYVTLEEVMHKKNFWLKIKEKDVIDEVLACRSVQYSLPKDIVNISRYQNETDFLIGMKVFDENQNYIGIITDMWHNGAHNTLVVAGQDNKEILIPQVDQYILSIDKNTCSVTAKNIQQLINL
jgi:ribosomal 30S subunit maturation factor RimM